MKNLLGIVVLGLLWCNTSQTNELDLNSKLQLNKEIIYGKLDNNFTYYIKQNLKPKNKASIHLILKAGSLMENDDQLGLAHLIEHMVFNGTKSYPKNEMDNKHKGKIEEVIYHGDHTRVRLNLLGNKEFILKVPNSSARMDIKVGNEINIGWNSQDSRALDPK